VKAASKIGFAVVGLGSIAQSSVLPAFANCKKAKLIALVSRDKKKATLLARKFGARKAYGYNEYAACLSNPDVSAIYIATPQGEHEALTVNAAAAGKHVLCEKPIGVSAADAEKLIAVRDRAGVKIEEAFMVRTHPRWVRAHELIRGGRIGELRVVSSFISYFNIDRANIRNSFEHRGGALLDIGCYSVTLSRFLFGGEPVRVMGSVERDPEMKTDRLTSAILEFSGGRATFTCSTQVAYNQRFSILGRRGRSRSRGR